jgi:hypothetical protein
MAFPLSPRARLPSKPRRSVESAARALAKRPSDGDGPDPDEQPPQFPWQRPYIAAVLETDRSKVPELIAQAESIVRARAAELKHDGSAREQRALQKTLLALATLRQELD